MERKLIVCSVMFSMITIPAALLLRGGAFRYQFVAALHKLLIIKV